MKAIDSISLLLTFLSSISKKKMTYKIQGDRNSLEQMSLLRRISKSDLILFNSPLKSLILVYYPQPTVSQSVINPLMLNAFK